MANRRTKSDLQKVASICRLYLIQENDPHKAWDQYIKDHMEQNKLIPTYITGIRDFIKASKILEHDIQVIKKDKEQQEIHKINKENDMDTIKKLDINLVMQAYRNAEGDRKLELCNIANMVNLKDFRGITQSEIYTAKELLIK